MAPPQGQAVAHVGRRSCCHDRGPASHRRVRTQPEPRSDSPTVDSDSARQLSDSPTVPTVRQSDSPRQLSDSVRQCFLWHHDRPLSDGPTVRPTVPTVPTVPIFSDSSDSFQQFQECRPCQQPWTHKNQRRCVKQFCKNVENIENHSPLLLVSSSSFGNLLMRFKAYVLHCFLGDFVC